MFSENICRLCLAIDVPVSLLAGCPLQEVYEKLTNSSLNTAHKPVVACSRCYWQLKKCHNLMTRSLSVDKLLTKLLQTGEMINRESISMIDRKKYKLENNLSISPMELNVFIKPEAYVKKEIKDEPFSWADEGEMESEQITCARNIKVESTETLEHSEAEGLDDVNDDMNEELSDVVNEEREGVGYIKDEIDIEEMKLEVLEDTEYKQEVFVPGGSCDVRRATTPRGENHSAWSVAGEERPGANAQLEGPFECLVCKMIFTHQKQLKTHSRAHSVKKPFECHICQRQLKHRVGLEYHLRTHTGEKPFQCDICHKSYKQKPDLNKHLRTHTGEKPFECDICKKRFNQRSTLNVHLRTHNEKKLFRCATCEREYKHKTSLLTHLRSHSGERPFECAVCRRRFIRRCDITAHLRIHSGERPYQCKTCRKRFNQRSTLMGHLKTHNSS